MRLTTLRFAFAAPLLLGAATTGHAADNFTPATEQKLVAGCEVNTTKSMPAGKLTPAQTKMLCECMVQKAKTTKDSSGLTDAKWQQVAEVMSKGSGKAADAYPKDVAMTASFFGTLMMEPEVSSCVNAKMKK